MHANLPRNDKSSPSSNLNQVLTYTTARMVHARRSSLRFEGDRLTLNRVATALEIAAERLSEPRIGNCRSLAWRARSPSATRV
jgi:hypothetical protein